jgi:haloalkane dehalogenase
MKKLLIILGIIFALMCVFVFIFRDTKSTHEYEKYTADMKSFKTDAGIMKYHDVGTGYPILLLHGVPTSSWMYKKLTKQLSENNYRVIAVDMIGFGASDKPDGYDVYDFDKQADRILALMESLDIAEWEQVIHDMGGIVTWEMMKKNPKKISHLYILNTIIYADDFHPPADFSMKNPLHRFFLNLHTNKYIGKMIIKNTLKTATNKYSMNMEDGRGYWMPLRENADALVHFFTHTKWIKENLINYRKVFKNFNGDISIIWGKSDPFLGVEQVSKLQNDFNIFDENTLILENAKHLIAEESTDKIVEFITKHQG